MNGIAKSLAQEVLSVVTETIADAYALLRNVGSDFISPKDEERDCAYLVRRFEAEGLTFLTTRLPVLGDWFDKWLIGEQVERVEGFKPYDGLYPCFLRPFWITLGRIRPSLLDPDAAVLLDPRYFQIIRLVRTILHGLKKLEVPFSDEQVAEKLGSFLEIEDELSYRPLYPSPVTWRAQLLLEDFLSGYSADCWVPKHGPGAVAGGEKANRKWRFSTLYRSLHAEYPYYEYHFGVRSTVYDSCTSRVRSLPYQLAYKVREYAAMQRADTPTARLLFVPKDSRGPRVISCEPKELMYIQQGVAVYLMDYIEKHSYTKGHVNFIRQDINGALALEASASKAWATLDLSDASDRVSCDLVSLLYPKRVAKKWLALRSTATKLPSGEVLPLHKFAPMGSAICFPVESLTFWAIAVACIWECTKDRQLALDSVYVYGDDIIVADAYAGLVMEALEECHLKVNRNKSFCGGIPFRESCGVDALCGHPVTPFRVKKLPPQRPSDGQAIFAYVKYSENSLSISPRRSLRLLKIVERLVGRIPRTPIPQSYLSVVDPNDYWGVSDFPKPHWDPAFSYYRARLVTINNRRRIDPIDSWSRLQMCLTTPMENDPSLVVDRSSTQIRRRLVSITYLPLESDVVV